MVRWGTERILLAALAAAGCGETALSVPLAATREAVVVANAGDLSVSLVFPDSSRIVTLEFPYAVGTPGILAIAERQAIIPLGEADAVAVVDFVDRDVERYVSLPRGTRPKAAALAGADVAWVTSVDRQAVVRVPLGGGATTSIPVGGPPSALTVAVGHVFVVRVGGAGNRVVVVDTLRREVVDSFNLSGRGQARIRRGPDALLYVLHAGDPGASNGSISVVDPVLRLELERVGGLGESPSDMAWLSRERLLVASRQHGILEFNARTRLVTRTPGNGIRPDSAGVTALAVAGDGTIYAANPGNCRGAGIVYVLDRNFIAVTDHLVGVCPVAIGAAGGR